MARMTRFERLTRAKDRIRGLKKHLSTTEIWAGTTGADVVARIEEHVEAFAVISKAEAAVAHAIYSEHTLDRQLRPLYRRLDAYLRSALEENDTKTFGDYGMKPPGKRRPMTVEKKLETTKKAAATREKRKKR